MNQSLFNRLLPDGRIFVVIGIFWLTWYLLHMIEAAPALLNSSPFMTIVGTVFGVGFGGAVGYYLGTSKSSTDKSAAIHSMMGADSSPQSSSGDTP